MRNISKAKIIGSVLVNANGKYVNIKGKTVKIVGESSDSFDCKIHISPFKSTVVPVKKSFVL